MIAIRADANKEIATGHIMRCMAIADGLKEKKEDVIFICADEFAKNLIIEKGYEFINLQTKWNNLQSEIKELTKVIKNNHIEFLIVDSYYVTKEYIEEVGKHTKIIYIDDINMFEYPVHTVINYSIYADKFDYEKRYQKIGLNTRFLLGCRYVPLRKEFKNIPYTLNSNVENIMITTGGTDNFNIAGKLITELEKLEWTKNINFHIVVGVYNKNRELLEQLSKKHKNIILHCNVKEMSKLMTKSDVVVSAGGSTMYEVCACKVPLIAVSFADNQLDNVHEFEKQELAFYAGDIRYNEKNVYKNICDRLSDMVNDLNIRKTMSEKMSDMQMGNGVDNIVGYIKSCR